MNFILSTDAAADLDLAYAAERNIKVISMRYFMKESKAADEKEYVFGNGEPGLSHADFYAKLRAGGQAKTTLIDVEQHKEYFKKLLAEGKDILHIPLSSGLSGTAEFAAAAAKELMETHPERKIIVVSLNGASLGQGLFVDYVAGLRDAGKSIAEAAEWANAHALKLCHYFTVDDLHHLKRGGRVSGTAAVIGTLIKIKPLLHINDEGKLIPIGKKIGRQKSLLALVEKMEQLMAKGIKRVFISHGDCEEDAKFVANQVAEKFGITDIKIGYIGAIVGAHSGPGTVALFFLGEHR